MAALPNALSINVGIGSQWSQTYTIQNSDGTPFNITGKTWEFVVRNDPSEASSVTPAIKVLSSASSAAGSIVVDTNKMTVQVILSPTATGALVQKGYVYSLWMDPGLSDATAWVTGTAFAQQIAMAQ